MSLRWSEVVPPEIVKKVKQALLSRNADYFYGHSAGAYDSPRRNARERTNVRLMRKGSLSADGNYFYDAVAKKRIKIENAIFQKFITFESKHWIDGSVFRHLADKEHGFMLALMPLLDSVDQSSGDDIPLVQRLGYLTYAHDKKTGISRNFVDPFFQQVLLDVDEKIQNAFKNASPFPPMYDQD